MNDSPQFEFDLLNVPAERPEASPLQVRVSARARRLSLRVYPDARVEVVAPPRVRPREIEQFVSAHRQWIEEKRAQALRNRREVEAFPPATLSFALTGEQFALADMARLGAGATRRQLRAWLLRAARPRLEPLVASVAARTGLSFSNLSIRRQRSRWGSCSTRGTISLNACLLFQRPEVVDYLIVHELTHTKHMNHSARFWQAVERNCPQWRTLDRELVQGWRHVPRWVFAEN